MAHKAHMYAPIMYNACIVICSFTALHYCVQGTTLQPGLPADRAPSQPPERGQAHQDLQRRARAASRPGSAAVPAHRGCGRQGRCPSTRYVQTQPFPQQGSCLSEDAIAQGGARRPDLLTLCSATAAPSAFLGVHLDSIPDGVAAQLCHGWGPCFSRPLLHRQSTCGFATASMCFAGLAVD